MAGVCAVDLPSLPVESFKVTTGAGTFQIPVFVPAEGHACDPPNACRYGDFCRQAHREAGGCGHLHDKAWPDCSRRPTCHWCGRFVRLDRWGKPVWHVSESFDGTEVTC